MTRLPPSATAILLLVALVLIGQSIYSRQQTQKRHQMEADFRWLCWEKLRNQLVATHKVPEGIFNKTPIKESRTKISLVWEGDLETLKPGKPQHKNFICTYNTNGEASVTTLY